MAGVHPLAVVEDGAELGEGTKVWHFAHVRASARLGKACNIGKDVYVDEGVVLGDGCKVQNGANLYRGLTVADRVFIGPHAQFTNDRYPRADLWDEQRLVATHVEEGASIGCNATVVCGITLGANCVVAAGAVVTRSVPPHAIVVGNPARVRGYACRCGRPLQGPTPDAPAGAWSCPCGATTTLGASA